MSKVENKKRIINIVKGIRSFVKFKHRQNENLVIYLIGTCNVMC